MQIFPAIDLRGGQVVRLCQGDYEREIVYGSDPRAQAREFLGAGARYLHVVDLDGARDGTMANFDSIAAIAKQGGLYIEVGGGVRTEERIRRYLDGDEKFKDLPDVLLIDGGQEHARIAVGVEEKLGRAAAEAIVREELGRVTFQEWPRDTERFLRFRRRVCGELGDA